MNVKAQLFLLGMAALSGCASGTGTVKTTAGDVVTVWEEYANVHVLRGDGGLVLVDAAYEATAPALVDRIEAAGFDPKAVRAVVVTHGHADHAGGAPYFRDVLRAKVIAGRADEGMLRTGKMEKLCPTGWMARQRVDEDQASTYTGYAADVWIDAVTPLASVAAEAGVEATLVPMPGHTDGSLVVVAGDAAFVGDLFRGAIVGSGAETHFYMCDLEDNRRDIRALLDDYPGVRTFFTGHFGPVERADVEAYLED